MDKRLGRPTLVLLLLLVCGASGAASLLTDGYQARYAVSRNGLPLGETVRTLRPAPGDGWLFTAHTRPTGVAAWLFADVIEEQSMLRITEEGIVPLHYRYAQHGGRKEKAYSLRFDWNEQRLHYEHDGGQQPLTSSTQDPLSFVLAVMQHLGRGEQPFTLAIAGRKRVRDYRVHIAGRAKRDTVLGRQTVLHIDAREVGSDTRYDLWCLPGHDYLPMRIVQQRKDETTDLRLRALTTPPPPVAKQP